jgi:hypothetical protein
MSADFQRLARVRARRSSRRKRWIWSVGGLGVASVVVSTSHLVAPVLPGRLVAAFLEPRVSFLSRGAAPVTEEAQGRVQIVEPGTGLIRVSSGFFGLASVKIVVTPETLIVVGDKEGGFGDIRDGGHVKAAYDARRGTAQRVEIVQVP